jgi:hypothetical protein
MQLPRLPHDPSALAGFYADALTSLGAVAERSWHDRLDLIAEGPAARLWNDDGSWHATELRFLPREATADRDAATDVFPGCPLTFRLAEALLTPPSLEKVSLTADAGANRVPPMEVLERLWRQQRAGTNSWQLVEPLRAAVHFSLVGLIRCEIQAVDQHWSLHRVAVSLADGRPDDGLCQALAFAGVDRETSHIQWPTIELADVVRWLRDALEQELTHSLAAIRARQETHLRRELNRIDHYFSAYEHELSERKLRGRDGALRRDQRLAAARAEHELRRADQIARHAIRILPRLDAALIVGEPAWSGRVQTTSLRAGHQWEASYIPRARRWTMRPAP